MHATFLACIKVQGSIDKQELLLKGEETGYATEFIGVQVSVCAKLRQRNQHQHFERRGCMGQGPGV